MKKKRTEHQRALYLTRQNIKALQISQWTREYLERPIYNSKLNCYA